MIKEHDRIVLTKPVPAEGLEVGDVGTVVHVYADGKAFEVEFTTLDGKTAAASPVESAGDLATSRRWCQMNQGLSPVESTTETPDTSTIEVSHVWWSCPGCARPHPVDAAVETARSGEP